MPKPKEEIEERTRVHPPLATKRETAPPRSALKSPHPSVHLYGILASEGRETHRINETQPRKNDNASLRERNGRVVAFYKTFTKLTNSITRPNALESLALARSPTEQGWELGIPEKSGERLDSETHSCMQSEMSFVLGKSTAAPCHG